MNNIRTENNNRNEETLLPSLGGANSINNSEEPTLMRFADPPFLTGMGEFMASSTSMPNLTQFGSQFMNQGNMHGTVAYWNGIAFGDNEEDGNMWDDIGLVLEDHEEPSEMDNRQLYNETVQQQIPCLNSHETVTRIEQKEEGNSNTPFLLRPIGGGSVSDRKRKAFKSSYSTTDLPSMVPSTTTSTRNSRAGSGEVRAAGNSDTSHYEGALPESRNAYQEYTSNRDSSTPQPKLQKQVKEPEQGDADDGVAANRASTSSSTNTAKTNPETTSSSDNSSIGSLTMSFAVAGSGRNGRLSSKKKRESKDKRRSTIKRSSSRSLSIPVPENPFETALDPIDVMASTIISPMGGSDALNADIVMDTLDMMVDPDFIMSDSDAVSTSTLPIGSSSVSSVGNLPTSANNNDSDSPLFSTAELMQGQQQEPRNLSTDFRQSHKHQIGGGQLFTGIGNKSNYSSHNNLTQLAHQEAIGSSSDSSIRNIAGRSPVSAPHTTEYPICAPCNNFPYSSTLQFKSSIEASHTVALPILENISGFDPPLKKSASSNAFLEFVQQNRQHTEAAVERKNWNVPAYSDNISRAGNGANKIRPSKSHGDFFGGGQLSGNVPGAGPAGYMKMPVNSYPLPYANGYYNNNYQQPAQHGPYAPTYPNKINAQHFQNVRLQQNAQQLSTMLGRGGAGARRDMDASVAGNKKALDKKGKVISARGSYKCGLCGKPKANHVCEVLDNSVLIVSRASQADKKVAQNLVQNHFTMQPHPGERIITVNPLRSSIQQRGIVKNTTEINSKIQNTKI